MPLLAQEASAESEEIEEENEQLLTEEQRDSLVEKLEAIEQGILDLREARHAAAFQAFEKVADDDLALYNFYKECVERTNYNDEESEDASRNFDKWSRNFDEKTDRATFAEMLRAQVRWLSMLKRAELLIRSAGDEGMQLELELAPELINICIQLFENTEEYGEYFLDLRKPATSSPLAQAFGLDDLETGLVPASPLDYKGMLTSMVIDPAMEAKNVPVIINAWNQLIRMERDFLRIQFEVAKDKKAKSERRANTSASERERIGNFEDSDEYEEFQSISLPRLIWQREMDRYNAGDQIDATKNLYNHLLSNSEHPNFRNWCSSLRSTLLTPTEESENLEQELPETAL